MDDTQSNQDATNQRNKSPEEIEADIAATRERLGQDIDELSSRVSPERLREQAQGTLTGVQEAVMNKVGDVTQTVGTRAQEASSSLIDMIKSNPVPAALIGLGVGLLAAGGATVAGSGRGSSRDYDSYGSFDGSTGSASERFGTSANDALVGAKALPSTGYGQNYGGQSYGGNQGYNLSGNEGQGVAGWIEDHPLAVGAVTLLIGAAIGLSAPGTRYENQVMGEVSDRSIERAKSVVGDVVSVAKESASQATTAVKQEWSERGPSKEGVKNSVKAAAETVTNEVKDAAKNVVDATKQKAKEEAQNKTENSNNA